MTYPDPFRADADSGAATTEPPAFQPDPGTPDVDASQAPPKVKRQRLVRGRAGLGRFVKHRATQLIAALIIGLGLGAGGMALIRHDGAGAGADSGQTSSSVPGGDNHGRGGSGDGDFGGRHR